jgi:sialic acid synthase SpsE
MKEIKIGETIVGGPDLFITFECGPNHGGSFDMATKLVNAAIHAGADAVKFQMVGAARLMRDKSAEFAYKIYTDDCIVEQTKPLYDILKGYDLKPDEYAALKAICDDAGVTFFCTALFEDQVDFLARIGCKTVKICSGDITNHNLIKHAGKSGMVVQFDTGNADEHEIEKAFSLLSHKATIIHHCPSGYPAITDKINLSYIERLKDKFNVPVAFSDHSPEGTMCFAAIGAGAAVIEKTLTLDRRQDGAEHMFSLTPDEADLFVAAANGVYTAMGPGRKLPEHINYEGRKIARRSYTAAVDIKKGQTIKSKVIMTRPEISGASKNIVGLIAKTNIKAGEVITRRNTI